MTKPEGVQFHKQDFVVSINLEDTDEEISTQFTDAISRIRPSRLDNVLEMEVCHRADHSIHQIVQQICDRGVASLTIKTIYPQPSPLQARDPRAYMEFAYECGKVVDQWTEMSRVESEAEELMIDVLKVAFEKKMVSNCIDDEQLSTPCLHVIAGRDHQKED